jgi:hypothetical protein
MVLIDVFQVLEYDVNQYIVNIGIVGYYDYDTMQGSDTLEPFIVERLLSFHYYADNGQHLSTIEVPVTAGKYNILQPKLF